MRQISKNAIEHIKKFEGFSASPYICPAGYKTVGYGHVIVSGEEFSTYISKAYAEEILLNDLRKSIFSVLRLIKTTLSDGEFDSLVSFTFNVGGAALQRSTLRRKINCQVSKHEVTKELMKWVYIKGRPSNGLIIRRKAEVNMFLS